MDLIFDDLAYKYIIEAYGRSILINSKNITWGGSSFELLSFSGDTSELHQILHLDIIFYISKELIKFFPYIQFDYDDELIITSFC